MEFIQKINEGYGRQRRERVLAIEYEPDGKLGEVCTDWGMYSFFHSKEWGMFYHDYGSGSVRDNLYPVYGKNYLLWLAAGIAPALELSTGEHRHLKCSPADLLLKNIKLIKDPLVIENDYDGHPVYDPFAADSLGDYDSVWCDICEDWMPDDSQYYCRHLFWSEADGLVMGCGSEEVAPESHRVSLDKFLGYLAAWGLLDEFARGLAAGKNELYVSSDMISDWCNFTINGRYYGRLLEDHDLDEPEIETLVVGLEWLMSLEPGRTDRALALTQQWIEEKQLINNELLSNS